MNLFDKFDCVRVINLITRPDRKWECEAEFRKHNMPFQNVSFYPAVKPTEKPDNWANYTLGCYGAFQSHLGVIKEFLRSEQKTILIHEDDIKLLQPRSQYLDLLPEGWDMLYFGRCDKASPKHPQSGWRWVSPSEGIQGLHAYALTRKGAQAIVEFLERAQTLQDGDPRGGVQHVDGAISMARGMRDAGGELRIKAFILEPFICHFRASATDIHDTKMTRLAKIPGLAPLLNGARKIKNSLGIRA